MGGENSISETFLPPKYLFRCCYTISIIFALYKRFKKSLYGLVLKNLLRSYYYPPNGVETGITIVPTSKIICSYRQQPSASAVFTSLLK